ncbi:hypothetical protein HRbin12_00985 [bacterium HR12]|nr:hypothetical protein HRbin12_00985 [bacterium HR12]
MASVLDILIRARDEASQAIARVGGAVQGLQSKAGALAGRLDAVGGTLTRTVTPAAAGVAVAMAKVGQSWDEAARKLRLGNTQAEFEALMASTKAVAGRVTQPLEAVADALDEVADRTGLAGKPLERLTTRFLQLEHITGEAASSTIPAVTRLFGDWSVRTREQGKTLDYLMRASEATGISVGELSQLMVQFGSPLRQLGFTFDETAAMFAKFEREGVNIQTTLPGLRMALKNLSQPSDELAKVLKRVGVTAREPKDALMQVFRVIKDMPSTAEANALAFKVFGTRAGPDMAAAIREGRFELTDLIKEVRGGKATIKAAANESTSLADRFAMLRNRVVAVLGPYGDVVAAIASGVASIGPALLGFSQLINILSKVKLASLATFGVWGLIIAAVVVLAVVIIRNWDKIKAFLLKVWGILKAAALKVWDGIKAAALRLWSAIKGPVQAYLGFWRGAFSVIWSVAKAVWDRVVGAVRWAWGLIKGIWSGAKEWFRGLFGGIKDLAVDVWNGIVGALRTIWNGLAGLWNRTVGSWRIGFPDWLKYVGLGAIAGKGWDVPDLPTLARGGIVTRPTLALVGEAGPEAVIPLGRTGTPRIDVRVVLDRRRFVEATDAEYSWGGRW